MTETDRPLSAAFAEIAKWWDLSGNIPDDDNQLYFTAETDQYNLKFNRSTTETIKDVPPMHMVVSHKKYVMGIAILNPFNGRIVTGMEDDLIAHFKSLNTELMTA